MKYLLDTNVVSELSRKKPDSRVEAWLGGLDCWRVSAVSLMEWELGILQAPSAGRQQALRKWFLALDPKLRVVPMSGAVAKRAAELAHELRTRNPPHVVALQDLLIAATAHVHGWAVATRNTRDFAKLPVPIFNPFP